MVVRSKLNSILTTGVNEGASDWHIREGSTIALRIDGSLHEIEGFVPNLEFLESAMREVTSEVKLEEYQETGDADFAFEEEGAGRFRANLHRQRGLMALTLRHVKDTVPPIEALGLPPVVHRIAEEHRGIILVTGTTGSGKSTTMACMMQYMNMTSNRHIITIEDPIEYTFKDNKCIFEQREVGIDVITFKSALSHALRQDPDVIMVGEMRDRESFESALSAADTGHLVLSTMHTANAGQSITRMMDMYPADERENLRTALAENLRAIICQRLVPRASGKGVVPCNEILITNSTIKKLILEDKIGRITAAIEAGRNEGMMSFDQRLVELVNQGKITEEAALEKSNNPESLTMRLRGIDLNTDNSILG